MGRKKKLSLDEALSLKDDTDRLNALGERLPKVKSAADYKKRYKKLRQGEKIYLDIVWLQIEVCHGGFDLYLENSSGDYAQATISSLEKIGARDTSSLLKRL